MYILQKTAQNTTLQTVHIIKHIPKDIQQYG